MKTNRDRTENKDWQRVDPRVLGQILAAQNINFVLPDTTHIAGFFAEILNTIPGVASCRVCLEGVTVHRGDMDSGICEACRASWKRAAGQEQISPFLPDLDFKCRLGEQQGMYLNAVTSLHHHFGFFIFRVSDLDVFDVYKPFISNLANYIALSLENRLQRDLLQKSQAELERKVEDRTKDLAATNVRLMEEVQTRRQAEEALQESERQIKQLIESSPVAMVVSHGVDERVEFVNAKFAELFGYSIEDIPDVEHWWPLAYPDEKYREEIKTQWKEKVEQAIRDKGQIEPMEATVTCKDGSQRYVEFRLSSVGEKHLVTFVDLTERKQAENALKERERHSQSLLRLSRKLEQAQTYADVLNAAQDEVREIIGYQNLWAYLFTPDKKQAKVLHAKGPKSDMVMSKEGTATITIEGDRMMEEFLETKEIQVVEDAQIDERTDKKIAARMGNRTLVHVPILLFDRLVGSVGMGTFGDEGVRVPTASEREYLIALASHMAVTLDRIHLLDERRQAEQSLKENEEKFRTLIEQSAEGVMLADEDGNIVEWNHAYERMTGLKRRQVLGQPLWDIMIQLIAPEQKTAERREAIKSSILETLRTGKSPLFAAPIEMEFYPLSSKDKRYFHQTIFPIETEKGYRIASLIEDITERKRMEEALRASEERLQLALDAAKMGQWDWNIVTGEVVWSQQCLALYGLPPDTTMSYERFLQALHPEDRERVDAALRRAVEERTNYDEMKRTIWPDGTIHWTASRGQVYCDAAGEPIRMIGVTLDISKWKEAEAQLLASEQLFRALVENSPDFIARYDREFRRVYVNPAIQRLFTSPTESVLGKTPREQTPLYAPQVYIEHLQHAIETAAESVLETPFRTAQGDMHWGQIRFVPEFDSEGKVATVLTIGRDIHEIKENEQRFRMLAENFPDFVLRFDHNGRFTYTNPAVEKVFGIPAKAIVGKTLQELPLRSRLEQNDALLALIRRAFDEGVSSEVEAYWETEMGERTFEVRHVPEKDAAGNVVSVLSIGHDITDRKRAERMLQEQYSTLHGIIESSNALIFSVDREYRYTSFNKAHAAVMQAIYGAEIQVGHSLLEYMTVAEDREKAKQNLDRALAGEHHVESAYSGEEGLSRLYFEVTHNPIRAEDDTVIGVAVFSQDVTERKQAEDELKSAHEQLARSLMFNEALLSAIPTPVFYKDQEGRYLGCNHAFAEFTGVSSDQIKGKTVMELWPSENAEVYHKKDLELMRNPEQQVYEFRVRDKDGMDHPVIFAKNVFRDENKQVAGIVGAFLDITERKQAEIERQAHLQFLESMDKINRAIQGANDLDQMMSDVLDIVLSIFDCDRAFLMYPLDPEASSWYSPMERTRPDYPGVLAQEIDEVPMDEDIARTFRIMLEADGPVKFGPGTPNPLPTDVAERFNIKSFMSMALHPKMDKPWQFGVHQCSYARIWSPEDERLLQAIGQRLSDALTSLLTYRNLEESQQRYRQLVDISPDAIVIYSYSRKQVVFVNPATVRLSGAKGEEELVGKSVMDFIHPESREYVEKALEHMRRTDEATPFVEEKFIRMDGSSLDVEAAVVPYRYQGEDYVQIVARDITERKHHEREREAIIAVSTALRQATTRTEILNVLLDQLIDLFDAHGAVLMLPDLQTGGFTAEIGRGVVGDRMMGLNIPPGKGVCDWVITNKKPYLSNQVDRDALFYRPDLLGDSHCLISVPLIAHEQALGVLWVTRPVDFAEQDLRLLNAIADIAANAIHRIMLHEQTELQLRHLTALHQIDLAISANFDLNVTLAVILHNVKDELEVDAVSILLLNPVTHTLDHAAGIGFRTRNIEQSHVRLGNGCAGRAAQEGQTVFCSDLRQGTETFSRASFLADEKFVSHYGTPLVVKGQVKGVLEIFHRAVIEPEPGWLSYFETLATQAAIAIENASLFENLQQSNMEIMLAYDATIEGWSRALDLRDRETEGHTQRVAEIALELAEKMGMSNAEKLDLRRGALLHDIGKMGIPDAILLKPEPLSEDEWKIMRQHPLYAYQMLSPIKYLKRALEVPYCHHEKWDGSGYPRGLKGDEIPLSARVFAVVDVFDAITSDRPYSKAWPLEKAYRYIQEQAGKHFDPQVAKIFLENK